MLSILTESIDEKGGKVQKEKTANEQSIDVPQYFDINNKQPKGKKKRGRKEGRI